MPAIRATLTVSGEPIPLLSRRNTDTAKFLAAVKISTPSAGGVEAVPAGTKKNHGRNHQDAARCVGELSVCGRCRRLAVRVRLGRPNRLPIGRAEQAVLNLVRE